MRSLICLTLILGMIATIAAATTTGTVTGTVVSAEGKPVPNLKVRFKKVVGKGPVGKEIVNTLAADSLNVATATTDAFGDARWTALNNPLVPTVTSTMQVIDSNGVVAGTSC